MEEGQPLHWRAIVERAEALGRKANITPGALLNAMQAKIDIFVRVASGTYGLREWGGKEKQPNTAIVARFLGTRTRPATYNEIFQEVGIPERMKSHSLKMSLDMHPRYYRSIENEYGLRAWLPPREMQRLSTPRWKVEAVDSFARVARAQARGYDVDAIVLRDIEGGSSQE